MTQEQHDQLERVTELIESASKALAEIAKSGSSAKVSLEAEGHQAEYSRSPLATAIGPSIDALDEIKSDLGSIMEVY